MTEARAREEQFACGARATFALIQLIGEHATYRTVCSQFLRSENGSSLEDVRKALVAHNIHCSAVRPQLTDLSALPLPCITHLAQVREGPVDQGHFLIITAVDDIGVQTYDPMLNKHWHYRWRVFSDRWYGYVIVPTRVGNWKHQQLVTLVTGIHLLVVLVIAGLVGRMMWIFRNNSRISNCIVTIIFTFVLGQFQPEHATAEQPLRSHFNSGANAAALLGGVYGIEIPPGNLENANQIDSLRDIELRLQAYGLSTSIRFLGFDALVSLNQPCVVPLRFTDKEAASFCIFIQATYPEVFFVEAGPLTARTVSVDDFRRYWTGYAVFVDINEPRNEGMLKWALVGGGLPLCGYSFFAYTRQSRRSQVSKVRGNGSSG